MLFQPKQIHISSATFVDAKIHIYVCEESSTFIFIKESRTKTNIHWNNELWLGLTYFICFGYLLLVVHFIVVIFVCHPIYFQQKIFENREKCYSFSYRSLIEAAEIGFSKLWKCSSEFRQVCSARRQLESKGVATRLTLTIIHKVLIQIKRIMILKRNYDIITIICNKYENEAFTRLNSCFYAMF